MALEHDSMMNPQYEDLLARTGSKFTLVTLGAKRARQINSYFNQLGDGLGSMVPPQVASVARKPLSIGFEEIAADKIVGVDVSELGDSMVGDGFAGSLADVMSGSDTDPQGDAD